MRNVAFLISGIFLFLSCENPEGSENKNKISTNENVDEKTNNNIPKTKWNGEYLKIEEEDQPEITRKSLGSEYYSMGSVKLTIGDNLIEFKIFERKKNIMTFTNERINMFIKSAHNEDVHLNFKKEKIIFNYKGKYKADLTASKNNSFKMFIKSGQNDNVKEYTLESGEAEIINFSPTLATFEMKVDGLFIDDKGVKEKGKGTIKMSFEEAIMTAM